MTLGVLVWDEDIPLFRDLIKMCLEKWRCEDREQIVLPHARHGPGFAFWEGRIWDGRGKAGRVLDLGGLITPCTGIMGGGCGS